MLDIERGQLKEIRPSFWQNDTTISKNSWGYVHDQDYKAAGDLISDLVDIVSKNGALLLNIGPKPDGTIPAKEQEILLEIGKWLDVNGEAVYGTRPWSVYGEGPTEIPEGAFTDTKRQPYTGQDLRFKEKVNRLYVTALAWPGQALTIHSLGRTSPVHADQIERVSLLGSTAQLDWSQSDEGLNVQLPEQKPGEHAFVIKIEQKR